MAYLSPNHRKLFTLMVTSAKRRRFLILWLAPLEPLGFWQFRLGLDLSCLLYQRGACRDLQW